MNRGTQPTRWSAGTLLLLTGVLLCLFSGKSYAQQVQTFTTTGGHTWTAPPGVTRILVETWGGGGRGGNVTSGFLSANTSAGGGGGAYSRSVLTVGSGTYYINVGAGRTGDSGQPGGDSWFHSSNTAPTSTAGVLAKGGTSRSGNNINDSVLGGAAGSGYGEVKFSGGNSDGGGGSSAGTEANGNNGSGNTGGGAPTGGGAGGNRPASGNNGGSAGSTPGGGGGGARSGFLGGNQNGGDGANGQVRITILESDVQLITNASSVTPDVGSSVTLTFTVTNLGPDTGTDIVVNVTVPDGLTYASHSAPSQGTVDLGTSLWDVGDLDPMDSATLSVTFTVEPSGNYTTSSTVSVAELDPNMDNNTSIIALLPRAPTSNLRITKEADEYTPMVGDLVTFTLTAYNSGPNNATNVNVSDQLPSGLVYQSHSGGTYNGGTGIWSIGSLANGATATLTITAEVAATGNYTNQATISGDQFDPAPNNDVSSLTIYPRFPSIVVEMDCAELIYDLTAFTDDYTIDNLLPGAALSWHTGSIATSGNKIDAGDLSAVPAGTYYLAFYDTVLGCYSLTTEVTIENNCADLGIEKTVNNPTPAVSQTLTFTLTITNHGPADATGIVVVDEVPNGYGDIANISNGGVWDAGNRTITWTGLSIADAANQALTYQAKVLAKGDGISHTNTASITALDQTDHNPSNDTDTLVLDPRPSLLITNPMIRQRVTGGG
ncbi:MAG: DUF11 domain-containing protein [Desulfotomaculaceae bacterium]